MSHIRSSHPRQAAYALLLLGIAALFFGGLRGHGVYFHDRETFRDNAAIRADPAFFFSDAREQQAGRPVAALAKWGAFSLAGNEPSGAHLAVVAAHWLASLLLAWAVRRLGGDDTTAALTGWLFLVNVAHFQAVFHISAFDFPLALGLALLACGLARPGARDRPAVLLLLAAATASHPAAAAAWGVLVYRSAHTGGPLRGLRPHLPSGALLAAIGLALVLWTPGETTAGASLDGAAGDPLAALGGAARMFAWMAGRLLTTAHWLPVVLDQAPIWEQALGAAAIVACGWLAWRGGPAGPWALWMLLLLLPFAFISESITTEGREGPSHYLYLASAGASALLALGLRRLAGRLGSMSRRPWLVPVATAMLLLGLTATSLSALRRAEPLSWYNTGRLLYAEEPEEAARYFRRVIDAGGGIVPLHEVYLRLALLQPLAGRDPYPVLQEAAERYPGSAHVQGAIAVREMESPDPAAQARGRERLGQAAEVARLAGEQAALGANLAALWHNLGTAYQRAGAPERAAAAYAQAAAWNPAPEGSHRRQAEALRQVAQQRRQRGDRVGAAAALASALEAAEIADSLSR